MIHLIFIQHFSTTFALKDRSDSEIIFHTNSIYLYESQELEEMCVSKPCHDLSHRHCTHDFHFVKSSIHLTRNSICHSWSCFPPFIHILPLFLNSSVLRLSPFAASYAGFSSSFFFLRVEVVQSSVHVLSNFPLKVSFIPRTLSMTSVPTNLTFSSQVQIFLLKLRTCQLI